MTPKSLPGFLRRTIRNDSDDDSDSDQLQSDAVGSPASKSLMINASIPIPNSRLSPVDNSSIDTADSNAYVEGDGDEINDEEEFRNAQIDRKFRMMSTSQHARVDRGAALNSTNDKAGNSGVSTSSNRSSTTLATSAKEFSDNNTPHPTAENAELRTGMDGKVGNILHSLSSSSKEDISQIKSYREVQFDKIISSPVVDIDDLRKLAWNGIPVSE
jgi:hypothetical protein